MSVARDKNLGLINITGLAYILPHNKKGESLPETANTRGT